MQAFSAHPGHLLIGWGPSSVARKQSTRSGRVWTKATHSHGQQALLLGRAWWPLLVWTKCDGQSPRRAPAGTSVDAAASARGILSGFQVGPVFKVTVMAFYPLQVAGLVLGFVGTLGTLATTLLPQWRVSAFVGSNIIVFERIWEGLWMNCIRQAKVTLQCKFYSSLLALPPVLEAARALMCVAVALSVVALLVGVCGMKQVRCTGSNQRAKAYLLGASGVLFILTAILVLIPVSWTANIIIRDFYNPAVHVGQKRELGAALFLGWTSAAVLSVGGGLLCGFCCCNRKERGLRYPAPGYCVPPTGPRGAGATAVPRKPSTSYV